MRKGRNKSNLKELIRKQGPSIVCIMETMMSAFQDKDLELIWNQGNVKAIYQAASGHS